MSMTTRFSYDDLVRLAFGKGFVVVNVVVVVVVVVLGLEDVVCVVVTLGIVALPTGCCCGCCSTSFFPFLFLFLLFFGAASGDLRFLACAGFGGSTSTCSIFVFSSFSLIQ